MLSESCYSELTHGHVAYGGVLTTSDGHVKEHESAMRPEAGEDGG